MIVFIVQQPTNPTEYAMPKLATPSHLNKPFLLICLFTFSTLAATLMNTGDAQTNEAAPAPMAREAGHGPLPVCSSDALKLSAHCEPGRQA
ncbi:hypothetical protein [Janthinobacterium sp. LB3P118]|uniref:hypothetical protein n=1 Tax=Janthinobacterium sp. LB3P118 TaxID=3424195 RepID=UPI003F29DBB3